MRGYFISAGGILILIAYVMFWMDRYYPEVQVVLPDRSRLILIDRPWANLQKCFDEKKKLISAMQCPQCRMEGSCPKKISPSWKKSLEGEATDDYVVHAGSMRVLVLAGSLSKQVCIAMAEQLTRQKKPARCVSKG